MNYRAQQMMLIDLCVHSIFIFIFSTIHIIYPTHLEAYENLDHHLFLLITKKKNDIPFGKLLYNLKWDGAGMGG